MRMSLVFTWEQKYFRSQSEEIFTRGLSPIPSQSARSRALARAVESPTTLTPAEVWEEMNLVLDTITSKYWVSLFPGRPAIIWAIYNH